VYFENSLAQRALLSIKINEVPSGYHWIKMEKLMAGILFFETPASCAQLITLQVCIPPNTLEKSY
jgi:hypothetical protein